MAIESASVHLTVSNKGDKMSDIYKKLDRLKKLLDNDDFLDGKGLSNEVNIRMVCYDPKEEMIVRHFIDQILSDKSMEDRIKYFNLYEVFLQICEEKNILNKIPKMEEKRGSNDLLDKILKFSTTKAFSEKMEYEHHKRGDVLMLAGVGEVYPFMRVHSLLEELQTKFDDIPIVVLYPGTFDGVTLKLFNEFKPNGYYRAFNEI